MDRNIVKKMNEIIGMLKVIERELLAMPSAEGKQNLINARKPAVEAKLAELDELMAMTLTDAQTINYHKQIKEESARVLSVTNFPKEKFF